MFLFSVTRGVYLESDVLVKLGPRCLLKRRSIVRDCQLDSPQSRRQQSSKIHIPRSVDLAEADERLLSLGGNGWARFREIGAWDGRKVHQRNVDDLEAKRGGQRVRKQGAFESVIGRRRLENLTNAHHCDRIEVRVEGEMELRREGRRSR